jgi:hypothetical protein
MAEFYWCLTHQAVEQGKICKAADRLGPYATEEEARAYRERIERRADAWKEDDERWEGADDDDG